MNIDLYGKRGPFSNELYDPRWLNKRRDILIRDKFKCQNCGYAKKLIVHHKQYHFSKNQDFYIDPWDYPDYLLITLCRRCDSVGRRKYIVPVVTVN